MIIINSFKDMKTTNKIEELHHFASEFLNIKQTFYNQDNECYNLINDMMVKKATSFGAKIEKEN